MKKEEIGTLAGIVWRALNEKGLCRHPSCHTEISRHRRQESQWTNRQKTDRTGDR